MNIRKEIIDILDEYNKNDGGKALYLLIFNILTENNTLKNYTENNNGIFFNLTSIKNEDLFINLKQKIESYKECKQKNEDYEKKRLEIIHEFKNNLSEEPISNFKKKIENIIGNNNQMHTDLESLERSNKIKKIKNKNIKKYIEYENNINKYKGVYNRINKVLKNVRRNNPNDENNITKDEKNQILLDCSSDEECDNEDEEYYEDDQEEDRETDQEDDQETDQETEEVTNKRNGYNYDELFGYESE